MSRQRQPSKRIQGSGALGRWWRRRFEENLDALVALGSLSRGLAEMLREHGATFDVFDDYRVAVEGRQRGREPGEVEE